MGGTCSKGVYPGKFTLADLKDLTKGETKQMNKGCGPLLADSSIAGSNYDMLKKQGFGWPDNGEFEYGGVGDECNMCSLIEGYGCECQGSGEKVVGKRGVVKRVAFKGDLTECCLANIERQDANKTIGDYTCDPEIENPRHLDVQMFIVIIVKWEIVC